VPSYYACRAYHTPPRYIYGCPVDQTFTGYRIDKYPCMSADSRAQTAIYTESGSRQRGVEESASEQTASTATGANTPRAAARVLIRGRGLGGNGQGQSRPRLPPDP
jgi:hypothetical protein